MAGWSKFEQGSREKCTVNKEFNELMDVCMLNASDDIDWGQCDGQIRSLFDQVLMMLLRGVSAKSGIRPIPAFVGGGEPVDLFKLFCLVRDRGGFRAVSEDNLWGLIAEKFGFDYKLCSSLKLIYFKYLDELDQWLNRITGDRASTDGSYECGGNLGLLSLEFEKRFRSFTTDVKELVVKDDGVLYDEVCKHINVALKGTLHLRDAEKDTVVQDGVVTYDMDDNGRLCNFKDFIGDANPCALDIPRKRKRDVLADMLSWIIRIAKNPCHPSIGILPGGCRRKEIGDKELWSVALSVREARLHRRYSDSKYEQSPFLQKKNKMHPSMYEDDIVFIHNSMDGVRSSERLLSLVNTPPCHRSMSGPNNQCQLKSHSINPPESSCHQQEHIVTALPTINRFTVPIDDGPPVENHVLVGRRFQAEVPIWTGLVYESDSKWIGTPIWVPDSNKEDSLLHIKLPGRGRRESCECCFPGHVECHRIHIVENRLKLRQELGRAFYLWKFDRMGEEVSLSWSAEEEEMFKKIISLHTPHLGKSYFPKKSRTELVSYYYNVYLLRRRSYQNRVTPKDINSDDDETEFGSVGEAFGYKALKVPKPKPMICYQNEQFMEFDC